MVVTELQEIFNNDGLKRAANYKYFIQCINDFDTINSECEHMQPVSGWKPDWFVDRDNLIVCSQNHNCMEEDCTVYKWKINNNDTLILQGYYGVEKYIRKKTLN